MRKTAQPSAVCFATTSTCYLLKPPTYRGPVQRETHTDKWVEEDMMIGQMWEEWTDGLQGITDERAKYSR